jgi:hypothetical protein
MRTLVENVKFERGKWYALRLSLDCTCLWMFFTPKRTVKFDTILKHMCKLRNETTNLPETVFSLVLASRGTTRYSGNPLRAPLPDDATFASSYVIHFSKSADGKNNTTAYAERV